MSTPRTNNSDDRWGDHASTYDRVFAPLTGYIAKNLFASVESKLPANAQILDIACGSGALLFPAIERAQRGRAAGGSDFVVGCDYSEGMVELARTNAQERFDSAAFRCEVQNGQELTFEDSSFDAVFSCFGIFLFEDRMAGWREAARVLKPGGILAATSWMGPDNNEMFRLQFGPMAAALPERITANREPPGWMQVAAAEDFQREVEEAGFVDVRVPSFHTHFTIPSVDAAWNAIKSNPVAGALLQECTDAERAKVEESLRSALAKHSGGPDQPIILEASCNLLRARRAD